MGQMSDPTDSDKALKELSSPKDRLQSHPVHFTG